MIRDYEITRDNIFEDLGLPDAEELNIKAHLAIAIGRLLRRRGLTQSQAAAMLGIDQPRVSDLVRGRLEKFSMEKLCEFLRLMGCDVEIRIRQGAHGARGGLSSTLR
jgi:predicted XRE-type DNA-binding protein